MRRAGMAVMAGVVLCASVLALAQTYDRPVRTPGGGGGRRPAMFSPTEFPGGHLKYTYTVQREGVTLSASTTTEVIPQGDGTYTIINHSEETVPEMRVHVGFFGISLRALGVFIAEDSEGVVDLSPLAAIEEEVLEPNRAYLLPDGGRFQTGDVGTLAGVDVLHGVYTHADFANVEIEMAIATDLAIRNILPFPPRMALRYRPDATVDEAAQFTEFSSVELTEFIWEQ